jgi:hypothetical protein
MASLAPFSTDTIHYTDNSFTTMSPKPQPIPDTISRVRPDNDGEHANLASDAFRIGIDADGRTHIFSWIRATVTVLDESEHVRTHSLADFRLSDWLTL